MPIIPAHEAGAGTGSLHMRKTPPTIKPVARENIISRIKLMGGVARGFDLAINLAPLPLRF